MIDLTNLIRMLSERERPPNSTSFSPFFASKSLVDLTSEPLSYLSLVVQFVSHWSKYRDCSEGLIGQVARGLRSEPFTFFHVVHKSLFPPTSG
jgi:hypothetical protein